MQTKNIILFCCQMHVFNELLQLIRPQIQLPISIQYIYLPTVKKQLFNHPPLFPPIQTYNNKIQTILISQNRINYNKIKQHYFNKNYILILYQLYKKNQNNLSSYQIILNKQIYQTNAYPDKKEHTITYIISILWQLKINTITILYDITLIQNKFLYKLNSRLKYFNLKLNIYFSKFTKKNIHQLQKKIIILSPEQLEKFKKNLHANQYYNTYTRIEKNKIFHSISPTPMFFNEYQNKQNSHLCQLKPNTNNHNTYTNNFTNINNSNQHILKTKTNNNTNTNNIYYEKSNKIKKSYYSSEISQYKHELLCNQLLLLKNIFLFEKNYDVYFHKLNKIHTKLLTNNTLNDISNDISKNTSSKK